MKKTYNLTIGEQTAERIKIEIGSAAQMGEDITMEVRGRDNLTGLPRKTEISSQEIREALQEPIRSIIDAVKRTLERASAARANLHAHEREARERKAVLELAAAQRQEKEQNDMIRQAFLRAVESEARLLSSKVDERPRFPPRSPSTSQPSSA